MTTLDYGTIDDDAMAGLVRPRRLYWIVLLALAGLIAALGIAWVLQARTGMGLSGLNNPVGWGFYIVNFVFWVGIAHSGTLISAVLHLVRSKWRTAIARSAEAMTVIAVATAGLFPLIHLGRLNVFYYILPYPTQRDIFPNFTSPLVWDVVAVLTYFTVSSVFFYIGLVPDLAAARDRSHERRGPSHWRTGLYRRLAAGWSGRGTQWQHYGRAYLFFAALATPLVVSVHSVVSWDFAMGNLPGWHTTVFAPYFVAGAIHSGLAMVLTLMIPMRRLLHLQRLIKPHHFDAIGRMLVVTALIVGYAYAIEGFIAWYSGEMFEQQFAAWRATGWMAPLYWSLIALNVLVPLALAFGRVRKNLRWVFAISILINIGMFLERYVIVAGSTAHDFMPHNWDTYAPSATELAVTAGAFGLFFFCYLAFARLLPVVAASEVKGEQIEQQLGIEHCEPQEQAPGGLACERLTGAGGVVASYADAGRFVAALQKIADSDFGCVETFTPARIAPAERLLQRRPSPVRLWTLGGALVGLCVGFALPIGLSGVNDLIVGGKPPIAIVPFCVIAFECTVLLGALANLAGFVVHSRMIRTKLPAAYERRFSRDRFGILIDCGGRLDDARKLLADTGAEDVHAVE